MPKHSTAVYETERRNLLLTDNARFSGYLQTETERPQPELNRISGVNETKQTLKTTQK